MATYQVRYDSNGQKILSDPLTGMSGNLATSELPGAVQPDGVTMKVDSTGILSAMGGNLLVNDEIWITESGTWIAPVTGWYEVLLISGGQGGVVYKDGNYASVGAGASGSYVEGLKYFVSGEEVPVVIGAGGMSSTVKNEQMTNAGSWTSFGDLQTSWSNWRALMPMASSYFLASSLLIMSMHGAGFGATAIDGSGAFYGAGGSAEFFSNKTPDVRAQDGTQGAV